MSDDAVEILGVGDRLREEIEDGPFDRFVIFTYGITEEYLDWFDAEDQVAICGPSETVEAVREADSHHSTSVYNRETHAKIYFLYNDSRVVAYLGSFNFTRNGLYGSVEWGARYEGELTQVPSPEALINGEAPAELSQSPIIEQVATIIGASMTGNDTHAADSWVANTRIGEGVVHTLTSNTLQSALTDMLQESAAPIEVSYYTPFVTYAGITEFVSYLPESLSESDVKLAVYTKRLSRIQADEAMPSADEITKLDDRFDEFQLRVRAPGDQGNQLGDGREIRNGMAHLKAITLTEQSEKDAQSLGTILTSANLSERAWSRDSAGFEIGVALTGTRDSDRLHRLFTEALPRAYVDPSERELATAGGTGTPQTYGTEMWLDTQLLELTTLTHDSVAVAWKDSLPSIESLSGTIRIRDTSTGDRANHDLTFSWTDDGFEASFPSVAGKPNRIIDFVRLQAETRHAPPELEYTAHEINEFRAEKGIEGSDDPFPDEWQQYDEIIWNGNVNKLITNATFGDVETIHSVRLRSTHDTAETYYAILEPDTQPHIDELLRSSGVAVESVAPLGELLRVRVETHPEIDPDPQDIAFYTARDNQIHPLGVTVASEDEALYYYFPPEHAGETLIIKIAGVLNRYIRQGNTEVVLPEVGSRKPVEIEDHFPTDPWSVTPSDIHPILRQKRYPDTPLLAADEPSPEEQISTAVPATVNPPERLLEERGEEQLALWWRPSSVFRSGKVQSISTPIPVQDVRTRVTYRGIVQRDGEKGPVNIWLPGGEYVVREQPFVDNLEVSLDGVPKEQNLERLRSNTLLGWITIQQDTLLRPRAGDVTECISPKLYVDETPVRREIFDTTQEGGTLCIPILGQHVGKTQTLTFRLWLSGGPAKTTTYTEAALDIELSVAESNNGLEITVGRQTRQVASSSAEPTIDLSEFINHFQPGEFQEQTKAKHDDEPFTIKSYDPLRVQPQEMLLLYFTDK